MSLTKVSYSMITGAPVNVLDYGAKGDGSTDDTVAIQAAINSGAKYVYFPAGTYMLGAAGLTGVSNQYWFGAGFEETILKMSVAPTLDMVYFNTLINFGIEGISFDGNGKLTAGVGHFPSLLPCIYVVSSEHYYIRNCGFYGFYNMGMLHNVVSFVRIENNYVNRGVGATFNNGGIAISGGVGATSSQVTISGNECTFCQISTNAHDTIITNNYVRLWGFSAGINTQAIPNSSYNLVISNNICFDSNPALDTSPYAPAGIENWASNSTITGNICYNNFGDGIDNGGANCTITGNVCFNNNGIGLYNLYQDASNNASNSVVTGNHFYDTRVGGARTQLRGYAEQAGGLVGITFQNNVTNNNLNDNLFNCTSRNTAAQYDWIAPSLLNSWINVVSATPAGYYCDPQGIVRLRGFVSSGAVPSIIFNLPIPFRPAQNYYLPIASNNLFGFVIVNTGGDVQIQVGSNVWVDLSAITFRVT